MADQLTISARRTRAGLTLAYLTVPAFAAGLMATSATLRHVPGLGLVAGAAFGAAGAIVGLRRNIREALGGTEAGARRALARVRREAFGAAALMVGFLGLSTLVATRGNSRSVDVATMAMGAAVAFLLGRGFWKWIRTALRSDGVEREVALRACATALLVTLVATTVYGFVEPAGLPHLPVVAIWAVAWTSLWISVSVWTRRLS